jgi:hypothetical protein
VVSLSNHEKDFFSNLLDIEESADAITATETKDVGGDADC